MNARAIEPCPAAQRIDALRSSAMDLQAMLDMVQQLEQDVRAAQHQLYELAARLDHELASLAKCRALVASRSFAPSPWPLQPTPTPSGLRIHCFGEFQVYRGPQRLALQPTGKESTICKYLAANLGRLVQRDVLLTALWPDIDPETANNRLKVAIHHLRHSLSERPGDHPLDPGIVFRDGGYTLEPEQEI